MTRETSRSKDSRDFVNSRDSSDDSHQIGEIRGEYYEITSLISRDIIGETLCLAATKNSPSKSNHYKLVMEHCRKIPEQRWRFSERDGYIHSGMDDHLCVVPNTDDTSSKRIRLILKECPSYRKEGFKWKFSQTDNENIVIMNGKTTSKGTTLVIEAARAVRRYQFSNKKDIIMVPTLATMETRDKGQLWKINSKGRGQK